MKAPRIGESQAEELVRAIGLIVRRVRATAPAEVREFTWTQQSVLKRLEREGPTTSANLARAEGVTPQSMGTAVAVLEEKGLVERKAHPKDGRQMIVKLTVRGAALRDHAKAATETWLVQALEKLDSQELAILFKAGEIMKRMAEKP